MSSPVAHMHCEGGVCKVRRIGSRDRDSNLIEIIFESMSEPIVLFDRNLLIAGANRAAEKLFPLIATKAIGRRCRDLFRCSGCDDACKLGTYLEQSYELSGKPLRVTGMRGDEQLLSIKTAPFYTVDYQLAGFVVFVRRVTQPERGAAALFERLPLEEHERRLLVRALKEAGGNVSRAARSLQITRDTLRYRMRKLEITSFRRSREIKEH